MTAQRIQLRRDTAADWTAANPTLLAGEAGVETDTGQLKIGDGSTAWTSLGYASTLPAHLDAATAALVGNSGSATTSALNAAFGPSGQPDLYDSYASKGTAALGIADSGQTWGRVANATTGAGLTIVGGKLTNTASAATAAAGYAVVGLGTPVTRLGADVVFDSAGSTNGAVLALIAWVQNIVSTYPTVPDAGFHLTISPTAGTLSYWSSQAITTIHTWPFCDTTGAAANLATDGTTVHRVDATIDGSTAYLLLPGYTLINNLPTRYVTVTDSHIASLAGQYACAEVFQGNASTDHRPEIVNVWMEAA